MITKLAFNKPVYFFGWFSKDDINWFDHFPWQNLTEISIFYTELKAEYFLLISYSILILLTVKYIIYTSKVIFL